MASSADTQLKTALRNFEIAKGRLAACDELQHSKNRSELVNTEALMLAKDAACEEGAQLTMASLDTQLLSSNPGQTLNLDRLDGRFHAKLNWNNSLDCRSRPSFWS